MIRTCKILLLLIVLICSNIATAQYFSGGQDPASAQWRQIQTPNFKLIYPPLFESKAQQLANMLEISKAPISRDLNYKTSHIPVVVHPFSVASNGFVAWAPKRIELVSCPPQDVYAHNWLKQLAVHEYRHVVQIERNNQGMGKFLSCLLGEQAPSLMIGLFVPSWFMEGDAVFSETKYSSSGRGRLPTFEMPLRAQLLQKGKFSYDKAVKGSYKDKIADRYELGYLLVSDFYETYGEKAWTQVLDEVAKRPYKIVPFDKGIKKISGVGKSGIYSKTMDKLLKKWSTQDKQTDTSLYALLTQGFNKYHEFLNPKKLSDTSFISLYKDLDNTLKFVEVCKNQGLKNIKNIGTLPSYHFHYNEKNKKIVWAEVSPDPRWQNRTYAEIKTYDFATRKTIKLTKKTRYFAPSASPDGKNIATVKVTENNTSSIVILDSQTGKEIKTLIASEEDFYMTPAWKQDGKNIVFLKLTDKGKSLEIVNVENLEVTQVLEPTYTEISNPIFAANYILFNAAYSGIENIYALNLSDLQVYQITSARFGASNADYNANTKKIIYSNYSAQGYDIAETNFEPQQWKPLNQVKNNAVKLYQIFENETDKNILSDKNIPQTHYISTPYKKFSHLFNFHSWAPAYINGEEQDFGVGASIMSQNELSTANTIIAYKYNLQNRRHGAHIDFRYRGWYPEIRLSPAYEFCESTERLSENVYNTFSYNLLSAQAGIKLPLQFINGNHIIGFETGANTSFASITNSKAIKSEVFKGHLNWMAYNMQVYHQIKKAHKDFLPRWGQSLRVNFKHSPFQQRDLGKILSAQLKLYFPAMFIHHSFNLKGAFQYSFSEHYFFGNAVDLPRGYGYNNYDNIALAGINYQFPLCYPDFSLGNIDYLKRIRMNLFYDYAQVSLGNRCEILQSLGQELIFDTYFLGFVFPLQVGIRAGYTLPDKKIFANFIFSVDLIY